MPSRNRARDWTIVSLVLGTLAACGRTPTQPTSVQPAISAQSTPTGLTSALCISAFSVTGWYDGTFHYLLDALSVAASDSGDLRLVRVAFTANQGGVTMNLGGVVFVSPSRTVRAGGTIDLAKDAALSTMEHPSPTALSAITVTVYFNDDAGHNGSIAADTVVPAIPQTASSAVLMIQAFTVESWRENDYFWYWPKLTLTETSGLSRAFIKTITFELLDVGPAGRVPPYWNPAVVPAGTTLQFVEDDYGGPRFSISSLPQAPRVSVMISFVDETGRGGEVSALAQVSR